MSKQCCATGSLHTGTPTGTMTKVHGLDCYVAEPPQGTKENGIIVIIPDMFGIMLPNNRILADEYAKKGGFKVYLPDFMNGFVVPLEIMVSLHFVLESTGFWNNLYKIGHSLYLMLYVLPFLILVRPSVAMPRIAGFFKALKSNEAKDLKVGAAGFCWGAKYAVLLLHGSTKTESGKSVLDCGFIAHPNALKFPDDIAAVTLPLSVANAEHDPQVSPENAKIMRETLEGLTAKGKDDGVEHEFVQYDGAHHGFAVRADEEEKDEAERGKRAEAQALSWFQRWLT